MKMHSHLNIRELTEVSALEDSSPEKLVKQTQKIYDAAMPRFCPPKTIKTYWWNGTIKGLKANCIKTQN